MSCQTPCHTTSIPAPPDRSPSLRPRSDIQWVQRRIRGKVRWIARDPLTTRFVYLSPREKAVLDSLGATPREKARTRRSAERYRETVIGHLDRCGLLTGHPPGHGRRLRKRVGRIRSRKVRTAAFRLLAIPIPLFDPSGLLERTEALGRLAFSRLALGLLLLASLSLVFLLIGRWESVADRWPDLGSMLSGDRVFGLLVAYLLMKAVHELCHALACRRFGGECHEIGVFLLAFMPCLYCDVTDIWKVPEKNARVLVAAAGIFAELALAVVAGFVWILTLDGPIHQVAFNLMVLGSVSTVLVNANPLLRYDGYYMLADAVDVPNLSEQSREAVWAPLKRWLSAGEWVETPRDAPWSLLMTYGLLSMIYRAVVLVLILWGLHQVLSAWGLELLSGLLTVTVALGVTLGVYHQTRRGVGDVIRAGPVRRFRWMVSGGLIVGIVGISAQVPFEDELAAVGFVKPSRLEAVYAPRDGFIRRTPLPGDQVRRGEPIAELISPEDRYRVVSLETELAELEVELRGLRSRIADDPDLAASVTVTEELAEKKRRQIDAVRREIRTCRLIANLNGKVLDPPWRKGDESQGRIGSWTGSPLDPANRNAWVEKGTLLAWIGDPRQWEVEAFISESDLLEMVADARCRIRIDQMPSAEWEGRVVKVDREPMSNVPDLLSGDDRLPKSRSGPGAERPEETTYRVTIVVDEPGVTFPHRAVAAVRIAGQPKTIVRRTLKHLRKSFRADILF